MSPDFNKRVRIFNSILSLTRCAGDCSLNRVACEGYVTGVAVGRWVGGLWDGGGYGMGSVPNSPPYWSPCCAQYRRETSKPQRLERIMPSLALDRPVFKFMTINPQIMESVEVPN
ncbi:hypothetical protein J6590_019007 [Homalodisca vitripennis]|nr:hypothetical protein J6590_019007 [Homalodisca vitripennis]